MGKTYECGVSLEKAQLLEPGLDVRLTVGGEGLGDGGIGAQLGEDVQAVVDGIAGAGAEGDNGLARKVVGLQDRLETELLRRGAGRQAALCEQLNPHGPVGGRTVKFSVPS